jgi:formate hydrogenlyase transcriptional activator
MLKITRSLNGEAVFRLSGRMDAENLGDLEALLNAESGDEIILDLKDLTLVDLDVVRFRGIARRAASSSGIARHTFVSGSMGNVNRGEIPELQEVAMLASQMFNRHDRSSSPGGFEEIIGSSPALEEVLEQVKHVAPTDSTVLIEGETGTGKELIARAIHTSSSRRGQAFVKLNCAAIPLDLLESELFGHERGAFTGAIAQKIGRFDLADKGTLFLDEVGDIPAALQPKLLRVLQEQEFERLGSNRTHQVDVRLVAATNRNLAEMANQGKFRRDLYYRLDVFPIMLPPLRERREDIPALVDHFAEIFGRRMRKQIDHIPREAMSALCSYDWPGNIRELQNRIERAVILSKDGVLSNPLSMAESQSANLCPFPTTLKEIERTTILSALEDRGWVVGGSEGAAAKLGVPRTTLIYKMERFGICRPVSAEAAF